MTKSTEYLGSQRETQLAEILSNQVPEIKSKTVLAITHNTNVAVSLINTETTLSTTGWKQAADFQLKASVCPESGLAYLDNAGSITCVAHPSGYFVITGATTAVVSPCSIQKSLTFSAGKFSSIKRLLISPATFNFRFKFAYTDILGNAMDVSGTITTTSKGRFLDLRRFAINRALVATLTIFYYIDTDALLTINGLLNTTDLCFKFLNDPVTIGFDVYNELDTMNFAFPPVVDEAVKRQIRIYLDNYLPFLEIDASTLNVPLENWLDGLASGCAYSVANGWRLSSDFNDLNEVRSLSLALVGVYSKIASGLFADVPSIPEHFEDAIENLLASKSVALGNILLLASIWALADEMTLQAGVI